MKNRLIAISSLCLVLAPAALAQSTAPMGTMTVGESDTADHAFGLGLVAAATGRYQSAIEHYTRALKLKPEYQSAFGERATAYFVLKQYPKALADFNEALNLSPDDMSARENRGLTHLKLKQFDEALRDYDYILADNPSSISSGRGGQGAYVIYGRGLARLGLNDLVGGYGDIELARKQSNSVEKYYTDLGFAAPAAKPATLPPSPPLPSRLRTAIDDTSKNPYLLRITVIDERSNASTSACVTGPALLVALSREMGLTDKEIDKAKQAAMNNKTGVFRFRKQASLDPLRNNLTDKDIARAKELMQLTDIAAFEGVLPGYREPAGVTFAMACSFAEQGKPVRLGLPSPKVLP